MRLHKAAVIEAITFLGDTSDQIAESLLAAGCTGDHNPGWCPLAVYLRGEFHPRYISVTLNLWMAKLFDPQIQVPLSDPIRTFTYNFDFLHLYPELER